MLLQIAFVLKLSATNAALERFVFIVTFHVSPKCRAVYKGLLTLTTLVWLLTRVYSRVHLEVIRPGKGLATSKTREGAVSRVNCAVLFKFGNRYKSFVTGSALKIFARVFTPGKEG